MWELDHKEGFALKNSCLWTVVLEKTLESPLDFKEIQPVHSKGHSKGDQSWVFTGRNDAEAEAPVLWPPDAKNWLIGKDPDADKDWRQEEKVATEDEMLGWHHWFNGHEFEQTGKLRMLQFLERKELDMTESLNNNNKSIEWIKPPSPQRYVFQFRLSSLYFSMYLFYIYRNKIRIPNSPTVKLTVRINLYIHKYFRAMN